MNLTTKYLGLQLKNPLVLAASPLTKSVDTAKRYEDAGASAVVMYSLFEEQIDYEKRELDHFLTMGTDSFAEALSYFPEPEEYTNVDAEEYIEHIRKLKESLGIPVIASGGVGSLEHLREGLADDGGEADAALAASIFHFGLRTIDEAKRYLTAHGIPVRQTTSTFAA